MPPTPHETAPDVAVTNKWFNVDGAADYAALSTWTIRQAVKTGELAAYAIGKGKEYRLRATDIDAWLMSRAWEPNA